jgi:hypothetical protein
MIFLRGLKPERHCCEDANVCGERTGEGINCKKESKNQDTTG